MAKRNESAEEKGRRKSVEELKYIRFDYRNKEMENRRNAFIDWMYQIHKNLVNAGFS